MLDFSPRADWSEAAWLAAPMPDAALCLALDDRLLRPERHEAVAVAPLLLRALRDPSPPGRIILACDSSGETWRLRCDGAAGAAGLWRLQSLRESRERLYSRLRAVLAAQLAGRVQHELRNPLNALSLHADLMARLLQKDNGPDLRERLMPSVEVIRQRLRELEQRQDAAVALWLAAPESAEAPASLGAVAGDCLRLLRGHLSLQDIRLHAEGLEHLDRVPLRGAAAPAQVGLLALLLAAAAGARQYPAADGSARVGVAADSTGVLEVQAPLDGQALARELCIAGMDEVLAGIALLLQPAGLMLEAQPRQALTRLSAAG